MYHKCDIQCKTCFNFSTPEEPNCILCNNEQGYFKSKNESDNNCYKFNDSFQEIKESYNYDISTSYIINGDKIESEFENTIENTIENKIEYKNFDNNITLSDFNKIIKDNISLFVNSSNVINGTDFIAVILSSDNMDPEEQIKNGISGIDLGNCTNVIKEYYGIDKNENLIIVNIENKMNTSEKNNKNDNSFNLGKNNQIEVYDYSGRKLNLSVCKENIKVMKYIGDIKEINIQSAQNFAEQGVDVFNASDEFFNNLCHNYNNKDGQDIIINDRRNEIYQNATFCENGCLYSGIDYNLMTANCLCDTNYLEGNILNKTEENNEEQKELINFKSITKSFIASLTDFNIDIVKCTNLVINLKILIKNYGFFSMGVMYTLQIVFLIVYIIKKLTSIKNFMLNLKINKNKNKKN